MVHWNIWTTKADGVKHHRRQPSWQSAFRFMDDLVDDPGERFTSVCYQRLPEGVWPTA